MHRKARQDRIGEVRHCGEREAGQEEEDPLRPEGCVYGRMRKYGKDDRRDDDRRRARILPLERYLPIPPQARLLAEGRDGCARRDREARCPPRKRRQIREHTAWHPHEGRQDDPVADQGNDGARAREPRPHQQRPRDDVRPRRPVSGLGGTRRLAPTREVARDN